MGIDIFLYRRVSGLVGLLQTLFRNLAGRVGFEPTRSKALKFWRLPQSTRLCDHPRFILLHVFHERTINLLKKAVRSYEVSLATAVVLSVYIITRFSKTSNKFIKNFTQ